MKKSIRYLITFILFIFITLITTSCSQNDKNTVTINFFYNYEEAPDDFLITMEKGEVLTEPDKPKRENYLFLGWYKQKECIDLVNFDEPIDESINVYAGWMMDDTDVINSYVQQYCNRLNIGFAKGDSANSITQDIILPSGDGPVNVKWMSSNDKVISPDGKVTRQEKENTSVTLTVDVTFQTVTESRQFDLCVIKVKKYDYSSVESFSEKELEELTLDTDIPLDLHYEDSGLVDSINGKYSKITIDSYEDALYAVAGVKSLVGISDPENELEIAVTEKDLMGSTYTFEQRCNGINVYGRKVFVVSDVKGNAVALNSNFLPSKSFEELNTNPALSEEEISSKIEKTSDNYDKDSIEIVFYSLDEYEKSPVLAYKTIIDNDYVFFDANNGEIIERYPYLIFSGIAANGIDELGINQSFTVSKGDDGYYYLIDIDRGININNYNSSGTYSFVYSEDNKWIDRTAVSAYSNMIKVYDWWKSELGRNSIDGNGHSIDTIIHDARGYDNACWSGDSLTFHFFDNSENTNLATTTASGLDIVAHEYTHGIVQFVTGGIPYKNATGAIDEGYADIFGCLVDGDWLMGEDWLTLRDVENPHNYSFPAAVGDEYYQDYTVNSSDHGGVHRNCNIISHSAYLMNQKGISVDQLKKIWYLSLKQGYTGSSDFNTVRRNVIKAAKQLNCSEEVVNIIKQAFDEVNIRNDEPVTDFSMPSDMVLTIGQIDVLEPELTPADAVEYSIKWTSSDESVATVNAGGEVGIVQSRSKGTAIITAELTSGKKVITKSTNVRVASKGRDTVLVLDVSGSMDGKPIKEMKKSAIDFCEELLIDEYNNRVGLVCFDDSTVTYNLTNDLDSLIQKINSISPSGTTNMESGLSQAENMLDKQGYADSIKNVVVMADGLPNRGAISSSGSFGGDNYSYSKYANAVVDTANSIMSKYNMYSLGFFHSLVGESKLMCTQLMSMLTNQSDGYHEVVLAEDLQFAFGDIADTISDGSKIVINIACPVDVTVTYEGESLSSATTNYNDKTSFGTLQLLGKNRDIKILSLDVDKAYSVFVEGTGNGEMDYSVNYINENDDVFDSRVFINVPITEKTIIQSNTNNTSIVNLNVDTDGDGTVDIVYGAEKNKQAEIIEDNTKHTEPETTILVTENVTEPETTTTQSDTVEIKKDDSLMVILISVVILILLIALILIIVILTKNREDVEKYIIPNIITEDHVIIDSDTNELENNPQIENKVHEKKHASICVVSGSMNGMEIPVSDGEVIAFGKDAKQSNVVFSSDYKHVSRLHCIIAFDEKSDDYTVIDNSTNGTFAENGIKLEKGKQISVRRGTILKLADEGCMILLK